MPLPDALLLLLFFFFGYIPGFISSTSVVMSTGYLPISNIASMGGKKVPSGFNGWSLTHRACTPRSIFGDVLWRQPSSATTYSCLVEYIRVTRHRNRRYYSYLPIPPPPHVKSISLLSPLKMNTMCAVVRGVSKRLLNKVSDHPPYKLGAIVKMPIVC